MPIWELANMGWGSSLEGTKKYDPKIMLARFEKHGFGRGGLLTWGIIAWLPCVEISFLAIGCYLVVRLSGNYWKVKLVQAYVFNGYLQLVGC